MPRHILSTEDLTQTEIERLSTPDVSALQRFSGKRMALLFCSTSTRTRLSFIQALDELHISPVVLSPDELRLADDETLADTATAVSTYVDIIGLRTLGGRGRSSPLRSEKALVEFSEAAHKPIINMASDSAHPCQALADLKTIRERFAPEHKKRVVLSWAYSPHCLRPSSIMNDLIKVLPRMGYGVTLCHPPEFSLANKTLESARAAAQESGAAFEICSRLEDALNDDAVVLYPRNWTTNELPQHGVESEKAIHNRYFNWSFSQALVDQLAPSAHFMHCMPVDRGFEAKNCLIDGVRSLVREQMLNRVPVQARLVQLLLSGP